jgi:hypothetical protein
VSKLKPGQSRRFSIDMAIHSSADEVKIVAKQIMKLQGGRRTFVKQKPEADPRPKEDGPEDN